MILKDPQSSLVEISLLVRLYLYVPKLTQATSDMPQTLDHANSLFLVNNFLCVNQVWLLVWQSRMP